MLAPGETALRESRSGRAVPEWLVNLDRRYEQDKLKARQVAATPDIAARAVAPVDDELPSCCWADQLTPAAVLAHGDSAALGEHLDDTYSGLHTHDVLPCLVSASQSRHTLTVAVQACNATVQMRSGLWDSAETTICQLHSSELTVLQEQDCAQLASALDQAQQAAEAMQKARAGCPPVLRKWLPTVLFIQRTGSSS